MSRRKYNVIVAPEALAMLSEHVGFLANVSVKAAKQFQTDCFKNIKSLEEIIYVFLTIFLYLLKCPQSLILSALRAFCFCGKSHIPRSIFLYFRYQSWLKSW